MTKMISGTPHKMDNVEAANSTQGHSRPRHPTAPPLEAIDWLKCAGPYHSGAILRGCSL